MQKAEPGCFSGVPFHADDFFSPVLSPIHTITLVSRPSQGLGGCTPITSVHLLNLRRRFLVSYQGSS